MIGAFYLLPQAWCYYSNYRHVIDPLTGTAILRGEKSRLRNPVSLVQQSRSSLGGFCYSIVIAYSPILTISDRPVDHIWAFMPSYYILLGNVLEDEMYTIFSGPSEATRLCGDQVIIHVALDPTLHGLEGPCSHSEAVLRQVAFFYSAFLIGTIAINTTVEEGGKGVARCSGLAWWLRPFW